MTKARTKQNPQPEYLTVPIQWKEVDDGSGDVEGFANVYEVDGEELIDFGDDIVERGAATKSIRERVKTGKVKLLDSHLMTSRDTHGTVIEADEREGVIDGKNVFGLWFRATFSSVPSSQEIRTKILERHLNCFSIGYRSLVESFEKQGDRVVRRIKEFMWMEVSILPVGMNDMSRVTGAKSIIPFQDLIFKDKPWDPEGALSRLEKTFGEKQAKIRRAFLELDRKSGNYNFLIADVDSDDELFYTRDSIATAAVKIYLTDGKDPDRLESLRAAIDPYLADLDLKAPWDGGSVNIDTTKRVVTLEERDPNTPKSTNPEPSSPDLSTKEALLALRERELVFSQL